MPWRELLKALPLPYMWWDRWDGSWSLSVSRHHRVIVSNLAQFSRERERERAHIKLLPDQQSSDQTSMKPVDAFSLRLQELSPHPGDVELNLC